MAKACRAPRSVAVKGHWRQVRKTRKKKRAAPPAKFVVVDGRNGRAISRHRTLTAAVTARRKADRASFRRGQGRPYHVKGA